MIRAAPIILGAALLCGWQAAVAVLHIPPYLLPGPLAVWAAFRADAPSLMRALLATLSVTAAALAAAAVLGIALAALVQSSRWARAAIHPWAVMLQVTPIVAVAPLIIAWIGNPFAAMVACATLIAFFPVFSATVAGLAATPAPLADLFRLYGATPWQTLVLLRLPAARPAVLTGLRISGGLALVGAVMAEFVAGSGGVASGLAYRILEAGYRLEIPRMFAALALLAASGIAINLALGWLEHRLAPA